MTGQKYKYFLILIILIPVSCTKEEPLLKEEEKETPAQDVFTNGTVIKYIDNGEDDKRINMVFIGDGFAEADQSTWKTHVDEMLENLFSTELGEPFGRYRKFFNIFRIDMVSAQSGLDLQNRTTPLRGMKGCRDYTVGDCVTDWKRTHDAIDHYMNQFGNPDLHFREVALNSSEYFGSVHYPSRGLLNTYSAGSSSTVNIFIHENGHIAGRLADEYVNEVNETYSGNEPSNVNVTTILDPLKWEVWKGYIQPYAYSANKEIGAFEGAKYVGQGIYRPAEQCMMNRFTNPFCAVCREKIILDFYREVRPVDTLLLDFPLATLELVDPGLFEVDWYIDEIHVENSVLTLYLNDYVTEAGEHELKVIVADKILRYSNTGDSFDWVRRDTSLLRQEIVRIFDSD
jgi:hypothetical protein